MNQFTAHDKIDNRVRVFECGDRVLGPNFAFALRDKVQHICHVPSHDGWMGVIVERQWRETEAGGRAVYYVHWIDPHGKVDDDTSIISEWELKPV